MPVDEVNTPKVLALSVLVAMLIAIALTGCSDDPAPAPAPTTAPTNTPTQEPTPAPTSTTMPEPTSVPTVTPANTSTPEPTATTDTSGEAPGGGVPSFDLGAESTVQQAFDTFTAHEQNCIRDSIDSVTLDAALAESFMDEDSTLTEEQEAQFFSCLNEETAGALFIALVVAGVEAEGMKVEEASIACMQKLLQDVKVAALLAAEDYSPEAEELQTLISESVACVFSHSTDDHGDDLDNGTAVTVGAAVHGSVDYAGDVDYFSFRAEEGELYQIDAALGTLEGSALRLLDSDGLIVAYSNDYRDSRASRIIWRAPTAGDYYVFVSEVLGSGTGTYTLTIDLSDPITDDHGDDVDNATAVTVGAAVQGSVDYAGDMDYFSFRAEEGKTYQIHAALGTLENSDLTLLDSHGLIVADSFASFLDPHIIWEAPRAADFFVVVDDAFGAVGSYTLTIGISDVTDDHGDDLNNATAVTVGAMVQGSLDYAGDMDYFSFRAEEGKLYQIDAALGTLESSKLTLLDSHGLILADKRDFRALIWEAPSAGDYYVVVDPVFGASGSYILTIDVSDPFTDDHGDDLNNATAVTVGAAVQGSVDYAGDMDYFSFRAEEGKLYQIDVGLGTLEVYHVTVQDPEGWYTNFGSPHGDSLTSRMTWEASSAGDYYVIVGEALGLGTYSLTITAADQ